MKVNVVLCIFSGSSIAWAAQVKKIQRALPFLTYFPLSLRLDYFGDGNNKSLRTVG